MATKPVRTALLTTILLFCFLLLWQIAAQRATEIAIMDRVANVVSVADELSPGMDAALAQALKNPDEAGTQKGYEILGRFGYTQGRTHFFGAKHLGANLAISAGVASCFGAAILFALRRSLSRRRARVASLTTYLAQIHYGEYRLRPDACEDFLSPLEDELYKTVVLLRESQKMTAAAKQSLADNLADIAHQLKTPLSSITLLADMLATGQEEETAQLAAQIAEQTERMNRLVSSLLILSRIDAGALVLEQKPVHIEELLLCSKELVEPLLQKRCQTLELPDDTGTFIGDIEWSIEAVANIIKDCSEHTPKGGRINVKCERNALYTSIMIEDNGTGIPPEDMPHIFKRFYRGRNAAADSTGIGLALAKAIVELQNGTLTASNGSEGGARFLLKFYHHSIQSP